MRRGGARRAPRPARCGPSAPRSSRRAARPGAPARAAGAVAPVPPSPRLVALPRRRRRAARCPRRTGMFAPSCWSVGAGALGAALDERDRVLLARRAARVVVDARVDLRGRRGGERERRGRGQHRRARLSRSTWSFRVGLTDRTCQSPGLASCSSCSRCSRSRFPAGADAAQSRKKAIWGPAEVNGVSQFPIYQDLGVGIWQNRINWSDVAPTRPGQPARSARSRLPLAGRAGRRDRGGQALRHPHRARPDAGPALGERPPRRRAGRRGEPSDFADFAYAASARYPSVRHVDDLERAHPSPRTSGRSSARSETVRSRGG